MNKGWAVYYKAEGNIKYLSTDDYGSNAYVTERADAKIFDNKQEAEHRRMIAEGIWLSSANEFAKEIDMKFYIDDLSKPLLHDELEALKNI